MRVYRACMEGFLIFFVFAIIAVLAIAIPSAIARAKATNQTWLTAARSLGLTFRPPSLGKARRMEGAFRGVYLVVDTFTRSSGKHSTTYTRYRARYPRPLGLGLRLSREGFLAGMGKLLGAQDIATGDALFDGDVLVKGRDVEGVKAFLTPERRLRLRSAFHAFRSLVVTDDEVRWEEPRLHRDRSQLVTNARKLADLAWFLVAGVASGGDGEESEEPSGAILGPWPLPEVGARKATIPVPIPNLERGVSGRDEPPEAAESPAEARVEIARETEWETAGGPEPERERELESGGAQAAAREAASDGDLSSFPEPALPPSPADAERPPLDCAAVCEDLFAGGRATYETRGRFEELYKGRSVSWSGHLKRADTFSYDYVLGNTPGTKAELEVHSVTSEGYGSSAVQAIVGLPAEACDALRGQTGHRFRFEGVLVGIDELMRTLYVADGRMERATGG